MVSEVSIAAPAAASAGGLSPTEKIVLAIMTAVLIAAP